jgi:hypothetical protein
LFFLWLLRVHEAVLLDPKLFSSLVETHQGPDGRHAQAAGGFSREILIGWYKQFRSSSGDVLARVFWLPPPLPEPEEGPPWALIGGHLANCVPLERNGAGGVAPQAAGESLVKLAK